MVKVEKKEFAWDTEKLLGSFGDDKKKTEVRICTLNGKTYVSAQSYVMSAKTKDWKRTKNNTMEMSLFKELQYFVGDWEMREAFENAPKEAPKQKKPTRKETDRAVEKAFAALPKTLKLKDLPSEDQKEVKSALKGNGMKAADVNIIVDGNRLALEVKKTKDVVVLR